jgi:hypothetical protein
MQNNTRRDLAPSIKLVGNRQCQCPARGCGAGFTSDGSFDAHRIGAGNAKRCATAPELAALGFVQNTRGFWRKAPTPAQAASLDRLRVARAARIAA